MQYYTTELLSANQELTPEGFLLCRNVRIARTGTMLYGAGEVPVTPDQDGLVRIERTADQVFADATMASFNGKPVTIDHPSEDVTPENWSKLAKGIVQNPRRGTGIDDDFIVGDLLITDAAAIQKVRSEELREVSCGYDADYEEIEPGRGRQLNIIGNHLALVEQGRCGSRCAIGDSMKHLKFIDRLRAAFKARDEKAFDEAVKDCMKDEESEEEKKKREEEEEKKKTSDALSKMAASLDALTERVNSLDKKSKDEDEEESEEEKKKKKETEDEESEEEKKKREEEEDKKSKDKKAYDAASVREEAQSVFARVEILSPGMQLPAHDAASDPKKTRDALCALKRKALENAFANPKTRDAVMPLVSGRDLAKLTCDALDATFVGASELVRRANNSANSNVTFDAAKNARAIANSISEINRKNREFYSRP